MPDRPWLLRLICCGRDAGTWPCETWDEADEIRRSYVEADGHDRCAIITTDRPDPVDADPLLWWGPPGDDCRTHPHPVRRIGGELLRCPDCGAWWEAEPAHAPRFARLRARIFGRSKTVVFGRDVPHGEEEGRTG